MMSFKLIVIVLLSLLVFSLISYLYIGNALANILGIDIVIVSYLPDGYRIHAKVEDASKSIPIHTISKATDDPVRVHNNSIKEWISKMEEKYRKTNERIRNVCNRYRETNHDEFETHANYIQSNIVKNMMVDIKHGLAYCRHGKV